MFGLDQATWATGAALLGGTLAATSHVAKATTRAAVNTSPEPFSNLALSFLGDAAVPGTLWLAFTHPIVALIVLAIATLVDGRDHRAADAVPARADRALPAARW